MSFKQLSAINRGTHILYNRNKSFRELRSDSQIAFLKAPKLKIYSFESRTRRNFFLPYFFPCFHNLCLFLTLLQVYLNLIIQAVLSNKKGYAGCIQPLAFKSYFEEGFYATQSI